MPGEWQQLLFAAFSVVMNLGDLFHLKERLFFLCKIFLLCAIHTCGGGILVMFSLVVSITITITVLASSVSESGILALGIFSGWWLSNGDRRSWFFSGRLFPCVIAWSNVTCDIYFWFSHPPASPSSQCWSSISTWFAPLSASSSPQAYRSHQGASSQSQSYPDWQHS